jgi:3-deoxy-D-manno-oct-2-ulosonic acid (Kdo) hydroxylase
MALVTIPVESLLDGRRPPSETQARDWCARLEAGDILFFPQTPIGIAAGDLEFLLGQQQTDSSLHKNIAYKPMQDALSGVDTKTADAAAVMRLQLIMRWYSAAVEGFLSDFLTPYARRWRLDYASFRPQEEQGRDLALRKRNDLLHTDAFPTRPTHGARILRFFNNIHPTRTRDWVVGEPFHSLVRQFAPKQIELPAPENGASRAAKSLALGIGLGAAIPSLKRSPYDDFMMRFHNFLKENEAYQAASVKHPWQFPAGSSWMVYTDTVPHAVLTGQYALEQTFLVAPEAMVTPETSPLAVLEGMAGARLV